MNIFTINSILDKKNIISYYMILLYVRCHNLQILLSISFSKKINKLCLLKLGSWFECPCLNSLYQRKRPRTICNFSNSWQRIHHDKKPMDIMLLWMWYRSWGDHILGWNILVFEQHDNVGHSLSVNTTTMYIIGYGYNLAIKTLFHV